MKELVVRLKIYLDYKNIGIIDLSATLGYNSPQKLYRLFNTENASPSCQIVEDIAHKFQELNLNWLFTGRGHMLITSPAESEYKEKYYKCLEEKNELYSTIVDLQKKAYH
jgi:hypothetical protein